MESVEIEVSGTKECEIAEYVIEAIDENSDEGECCTDKEHICCENIPTKKKYLHYQQSWETTFDWVRRRNNRAYCTVCDKALQNHLGHLKRHDKRNNHQKNLNNKRTQLDFLRKKWETFKENHKQVLDTHYKDLKTYSDAPILSEDLDVDDTDEIEQHDEVSFEESLPLHKKRSKIENNVSTEFSTTRRRPKRKGNVAEYVEIERENLEMLKAEDSKFDENYNFLISFLPYMKRMSQTQNLQFRVDMSELLLKTFHNTDSPDSDSFGTLAPTSSSDRRATNF